MSWQLIIVVATLSATAVVACWSFFRAKAIARWTGTMYEPTRNIAEVERTWSRYALSVRVASVALLAATLALLAIVLTGKGEPP